MIDLDFLVEQILSEDKIMFDGGFYTQEEIDKKYQALKDKVLKKFGNGRDIGGDDGELSRKIENKIDKFDYPSLKAIYVSKNARQLKDAVKNAKERKDVKEVEQLKDGTKVISSDKTTPAKRNLKALMQVWQTKINSINNRTALDTTKDAAAEKIVKNIDTAKALMQHLGELSDDALNTLATAKGYKDIDTVVLTYTDKNGKFKFADEKDKEEDNDEAEQWLKKNDKGKVSFEEPASFKDAKANVENEKKGRSIPAGLNITQEDIDKEFEKDERKNARIAALSKKLEKYLDVNSKTGELVDKLFELGFLKSHSYKITGSKRLENWYATDFSDILKKKTPAEVEAAINKALNSLPRTYRSYEEICSGAAEAKRATKEIVRDNTNRAKGHANASQQLVKFLAFTSEKTDNTNEYTFNQAKEALLSSLRNVKTVNAGNDTSDVATKLIGKVEAIKWEDLKFDKKEAVNFSYAGKNGSTVDVPYGGAKRYNTGIFKELYKYIDALKSYRLKGAKSENNIMTTKTPSGLPRISDANKKPVDLDFNDDDNADDEKLVKKLSNRKDYGEDYKKAMNKIIDTLVNDIAPYKTNTSKTSPEERLNNIKHNKDIKQKLMTAWNKGQDEFDAAYKDLTGKKNPVKIIDTKKLFSGSLKSKVKTDIDKYDDEEIAQIQTGKSLEQLKKEKADAIKAAKEQNKDKLKDLKAYAQRAYESNKRNVVTNGGSKNLKTAMKDAGILAVKPADLDKILFRASNAEKGGEKQFSNIRLYGKLFGGKIGYATVPKAALPDDLKGEYLEEPGNTENVIIKYGINNCSGKFHNVMLTQGKFKVQDFTGVAKTPEKTKIKEFLASKFGEDTSEKDEAKQQKLNSLIVRKKPTVDEEIYFNY